MTTNQIGFIGLGTMGAIMARRLQDAGYELTVHNRTPDRAGPFVAGGARWAADSCAVGDQANLVISMVADDSALADVALGKRGLLSCPRPGLVYVDMSTVSASVSNLVAEAADRAGAAYIRAPVTGSTMLAESGSVGILASGPEQALRAVRHPLEVLGNSIRFLGPGEEARVMKLALNLLVAQTVVGLGEALSFGSASGLDWSQMLEVFAESAIASPLVRYKAPGLQARDFSPAFTTKMMAKDLDLALEQAQGTGAALPLTGLCREVLEQTTALGFAESDFSAVTEYFLNLLATRRPGQPSSLEGTGQA